MKRTFLLSLVFVLNLSIRAADTIRVACVGNSITYGFSIKNRATDSYPAVLGELLGKSFKVSNFGVSGRTLLTKGDFPYLKEKAYMEALASNPNIVIIKLGTNDTKPQNWKFKDDFKYNLLALVDSFQQLPSNPRIFICTPAKAYGMAWGINDSIIVNGILPTIRKIINSKSTSLGFIDFYNATINMPENFPDKIHPNEKGARIMAETAFQAIKYDNVTSAYFSDVLSKNVSK
jgi:lysophospholipase L1-like esterase